MDEPINNNIRGQRSKECSVTGCTKKGRVLATLGTTQIAYCGTHRKKFGERIVNALINSRFNYKLTNFLSEIKTHVFMSQDMFCDCCGSKLSSYILNKTVEMEEILDYAYENDVQYDPEKNNN